MINDGMDNFDAWLQSPRDFERFHGLDADELDAEREAMEAHAERDFDRQIDEHGYPGREGVKYEDR